MSWKRRLIGLLVALLLLPIGALAWRVIPVVRDDLKLDAIVLAVALDWRDNGRERAWQTLQYELDHQAIGAHVNEDDCAMEEDPELGKSVRCAWRVRVGLPGVDRTWELAFESKARIDLNGVLVR